MAKYVAPAFRFSAFTCMFCEVLAPVRWRSLYVRGDGSYTQSDLEFGYCTHCKKNSLWLDQGEDQDAEGNKVRLGRLVLPSSVSAPLGHQDLPTECRQDFDEAREIASLSPRGAAALLRLALQKLCIHLGGKGKNINDDIGRLVKKGLAPQIQQALDYVRVTGNNAVHPGEISLEENPEHVSIMFDMINLIVEELIHRPRLIAERFQRLPEGSLKAIENRDGPKLLTNENGG